MITIIADAAFLLGTISFAVLAGLAVDTWNSGRAVRRGFDVYLSASTDRRPTE